MTQDMKKFFAGMGFGENAFAWPKAGATMPAMGDWVRIQQDLAKAAMEFGQSAMTMAKTDMAVGGDVMRRLMQVRTPEEFAAWQRDMLELVNAKYFEQWTKFGEQVQVAFTKTATPAEVEPEIVTKPKKAA